MRINGVWVGWGLGDESRTDDTVRRFRDFARRMYRRYMGHLADNNKFDQELFDAVVEMQARLEADKIFQAPYIRGVLDLETQYASGFKKRPVQPKILPIIFTVEGHLSNMFLGPCAQTAVALERAGIAHWKPVGDWNNAALPFDNKSGVEALYRQLSSEWIEGPMGPDGKPIMWYFGKDVPWGGIGFSQGAMVFCEFMWKYVLPPNAPLHYRLKTFRRGLMFGNPRRARDAICAWAASPPDSGTSGIMQDRLFDAVKEGVGDRWAENANDDDMFAEVNNDEVGKNQTAIAKIITENSWTGGEVAILARVMRLFTNPTAGAFSVIMAIVDAIMFLAKNPNPHYSTFATPGDIEWMRGVAA